MRKLMLKKEVVARIEHDEMLQLKGGTYVVTTMTFDAGMTCDPVINTVNFGRSCNGTCNGTCPADYTCQGPTCNGANTCYPYQCATQGCPAKTIVYDDCPTGQSTPMKTC